ncbi:acetyl-CoA carboxylase, carboxyltransferase subunit beta [Dichotomicrobium thermohalophilum]|uniref:Acetyl-coenzyme A carboxylase carboxyl transferase subunit beta n=1 Tax=Dichotomicrobium thermohalophilum TaxID=933063 RepID=A0A397QEX4_9HYPH|nr:acetyl-CoA carboxylase, carboxyltransferase subunit beta [Dichotomicrobium thermohalophilum]RIA56841.1 acetyl-CoA carboxylase carboxyl transferase subunit beta [Dichotomicrobium thermohalophilum]
MNWINNVVRPKIRDFWRKREMPDNLWVKCPDSGQMIFYRDLEANQFVVPGSGYHMRMAAPARLASLFDDGEYEKIELPDVPVDPLKFRDERRYTDRLKDARTKTGQQDAVLVGAGTLDGRPVTAAVQDFNFMGGSLGMAAGEAVLKGMFTAVERGTPFILFAASGGARMQEGVLSLMQMPRTTVGVQRLNEARLPYIVVLTHPTTGGVTASYAMLGDVHLAEPGALIGFAGPRVIEQTIREKLPEGFQRAEYLLEHGMVDKVVHRHQLRATISRICALLMAQRQHKHAQPQPSDAPRIGPPLNGAGAEEDASVPHGAKPNGRTDGDHTDTTDADEAATPPANGEGADNAVKTTRGDTHLS